jgi:hypothetical protein
VSSRRPFAVVVTNRVDFGAVSRSTTAQARASCALSVFSSRAARLREYCQIARHAFGWSLSFQTGSARRRRLLTTERPCRGVIAKDDLPIGENIAVPMEVGCEITGRFRGAGADDELQPGLVQRCEIGRGQHPGVGGDDHLDPVEVVTGLELPHDLPQSCESRPNCPRSIRSRAGNGAIHQQPDNDLRVDSSFFRVPDFPQVIFLFCLEVQGRHVVQQQAQAAGFGGMSKALLSDPVPVLTCGNLLEVPFDRGVARRVRPEILQHPAGIEFRAGFDDAAITRSRSTASSMIPNPSWSYTWASTCRRSTDPVDSVRPLSSGRNRHLASLPGQEPASAPENHHHPRWPPPHRHRPTRPGRGPHPHRTGSTDPVIGAGTKSVQVRAYDPRSAAVPRIVAPGVGSYNSTVWRRNSSE